MAASEIFKMRSFEDPYDSMGYSADCGPLIEKGRRSQELIILERWGFTPAQYNEELKRRMAEPDGSMSHGVYWLLQTLEVPTLEEYRGNTTVFDGMEHSSIGYLYGDDRKCLCGAPIYDAKREKCLDCIDRHEKHFSW